MEQTIGFLEQFPYLTALITFTIGLITMPFVLNFAKSRNMVVRPNKRTSHTGSVPNIGGLNIFASLILIFIIMLIGGKMRPPFFIGFCLIFIIGFIDDRLVLSAYWKIVGETLCAFFLIYFADIRITSLYGIFGIYELHPMISYALSYLAYMVIINALNLIDGVDGLASGLSILYFLFFGIWFLLAGITYYSVICFAVIGSLTVFFLYNVFGSSKRKIFMGDSGSLMLGYIISGTVIILAADKNHIHHLLLRLGMSHKQVTFLLLAITLVYFFIAIVLKDYSLWVQLFIILLIGCMIIFIIWKFINIKNQKQNNETLN